MNKKLLSTFSRTVDGIQVISLDLVNLLNELNFKSLSSIPGVRRAHLEKNWAIASSILTDLVGQRVSKLSNKDVSEITTFIASLSVDKELMFLPIIPYLDKQSIFNLSEVNHKYKNIRILLPLEDRIGRLINLVKKLKVITNNTQFSAENKFTDLFRKLETCKPNILTTIPFIQRVVCRDHWDHFWVDVFNRTPNLLTNNVRFLPETLHLESEPDISVVKLICAAPQVQEVSFYHPGSIVNDIPSGWKIDWEKMKKKEENTAALGVIYTYYSRFYKGRLFKNIGISSFLGCFGAGTGMGLGVGLLPSCLGISAAASCLGAIVQEYIVWILNGGVGMSKLVSPSFLSKCNQLNEAHLGECSKIHSSENKLFWVSLIRDDRLDPPKVIEMETNK